MADPTYDARMRYKAAMHAMQTGVMYQMEQGGNPKETQPKHLRVGINAAMIDSGALAALLIRKGVFTEVEYFEALADMAEREAEDYRERVRQQFGNDNITLG